MKQIKEQTNIVKQLLSKQEIDNNIKHRKFFYIVESSVDGGVLLFNTITYEFLFLNNEEYGLLNNPDLNNSVVRYLAEQYFLVPENFDDKKFASQVIDTRLMIQDIYRNVPLSSFIILPTTGCNARCFYCFEQGAKVSNMTEQTAHDVADFIKRKGAENIGITWFGGEPLINQKAIDIICKDLKENNIKFTSRMITNGYLFDEETIKKAIESWNLKKVQITLDGTEAIYNKIKDYVYKDVSSPFIKVLNNIESALKADINIRIRLNMDKYNMVDLFDLSKLLVERFNKYQNCSIYVARLYEDFCSNDIVKSTEERHKLTDETVKLQLFINKNMPKVIFDKSTAELGNSNSCMASNDSSVMIVPDGHLGKCEHYIDSDFYGSIYSDEIDLEKIARYKERAPLGPMCEDCEFRSLCLRLKCCNGAPKHCDEFDKKAIKTRLTLRMANIYKNFAAENNEN